jgi:hypothetical protein
VKQRLPWLVVNLFTASLSAIVISQVRGDHFQHRGAGGADADCCLDGRDCGNAIAGGGGAGAGDARPDAGERRRVVLRELGAGVLNGLGAGADPGGWRGLVLGDWHLGLVLGMAMIVNQIVAALGGVMVPLTLERFRLDPALASGTFVTTLTDVMGFFAFLGLARYADGGMTDIKAAARARRPFTRRERPLRPGRGRRPRFWPTSWRSIGARSCRATCRCGPRSTPCPPWPRIRGRWACR